MMVCKKRSSPESKVRIHSPITDSGAILLSDAVILQACKDYRSCLRRISRTAGRENSKPASVIREVESFLLHSRMVTLRNLDGREIVRQLRAEGGQ